MANIAYLIKESHMGFNEIMDLPYAIFLSLLKQFQVMNMKQSEEGREQLKLRNSLYQTEPDLIKIRGMKGYKKED
jgi:hypothetical protein